jgi:hypothetical protein
MIQLNNLRQMRAHLPETMCARVEAIVRETLGLPSDVSADDIDFAGVFGCPMFLVEIVADLAAVRSFDKGPNGRLSLLDAASEWFDIARWDEGGAYAVFATVESADGGPQWFIPRDIAVLVPNVGASIDVKHAAM